MRCVLILVAFVASLAAITVPALGQLPNTILDLNFENTTSGTAGETPSTGAGIAYEAGAIGQGAYFGSGSNLRFNAASNILATEGTVEFWVKPRWAGNNSTTFTFLRWGTSGGGMLIAKDGANNLRIILNQFGAGGQSEVGCATNINSWSANQWRYVAFTWSSTQRFCECYVDGQRISRNTFTSTLPSISATTFQIGGDGTAFCNAVLDRFRVSDAPLSQQQVLASYLQGQIFQSLTIRNDNRAALPLLQGQTRHLRAFATTALGSQVDVTSQATWTSDAPATASVMTFGDERPGRVTGLAAGQATVSASAGGQTASTLIQTGANTVDLDVLFLARTPAYDYDAVPNGPSPGSPVTYSARIRNWSGQSFPSVGFRWEIDGQVVQTGSVLALGPGEERSIDHQWTWQAGTHTISFLLDPANLIAEASESNNRIDNRTNAIIAGFWAEESVWNYFQTHQRSLGIGSNSFGDWIQRQMSWHNDLCAAAIYPNAPQGVIDRVAIHKIVVVPDGALPLSGGIPSNHPDLSDKSVDLEWGFNIGLLDSGFYANTSTVGDSNPFYREPSLLHELGHARYLIDCYGFDVGTSGAYNPVQILENGVPVAGSPLMPFIAWNSILYYNVSGGVMSGPYGMAWSPYEAGALNLIAGQRARCGNVNAPCNIGEFLQNLPAQNALVLSDNRGYPLTGADVRVYRAVGSVDNGWYGKLFDNTPDMLLIADRDGRVQLGANPFSGGPAIQHTYGISNGVIILRVARAGNVAYRFLEVSAFNLAFWAGHTGAAEYRLTVPGVQGCVANFDGVNGIEVTDIFAFLSAWFASDPRADINGGGLSVQDIFDFLAAWFGGC